MIATIYVGIKARPELLQKASVEVPFYDESLGLPELWRVELRGNERELDITEFKETVVRWFAREHKNSGDVLLERFVESLLVTGYACETFDKWWKLTVYDDLVEYEKIKELVAKQSEK